MGRKSGVIIVLVMCANTAEAKRLARAAVDQRLAACGNIMGANALSIYRWKEKVDQAREVLLIVKTTRSRFSALEQLLRKLHSYEVPEIIALDVFAGSAPYLDWVQENVADQRTA